MSYHDPTFDPESEHEPVSRHDPTIPIFDNIAAKAAGRPLPDKLALKIIQHIMRDKLYFFGGFVSIHRSAVQSLQCP